MAEWHVTPDHIVNNWTDELLNLMVEKMAERKERESQPPPPDDSGGKKVPDSVLFARAGNLIKVKKVNGD